MRRCGRLGALRLCSPLAWGILASWMLWALQIADFNEVRSTKKTLPYVDADRKLTTWGCS
jgi:hypothetical protein